MAYKDHELWCFLFVTLFNLQGACLLRRNIAIITALPAFVNRFFRFLFNLFQRPPAPSPLPHSFVRIPKRLGKVNPLFSNLCTFFLLTVSASLCPLRSHAALILLILTISVSYGFFCTLLYLFVIFTGHALLFVKKRRHSLGNAADRKSVV